MNKIVERILNNSNFFLTETESEVNTRLNINPEQKQTGGNMNANYSATSSVFNNQQMGGGMNANNYSATSSVFNNQQMGGGMEHTNQNINKLVSMLTSESNNELKETSTESLEAQLRSIVGQQGGSNNFHMSNNQNGGSNNFHMSNNQNGGSVNVNDVKKFFTELKSSGVNVNVKLNNQTMSDFFNSSYNTTTDISVGNKMSENATSSVNIQDILGGFSQNGGKKEKKEKKTRKISPGFQAFLDLKKHVAESLKISNGPKAAKVAGAVQTIVKEKNPNISDTVKISKLAIKHFDSNKKKFQDMLNEI